SAQGRLRVPASASQHGADPEPLGTARGAARPRPTTAWSLPDPRSSGRHAADLFGAPGQAPLPVLPGRLPCPRQRVGLVGGGPPPAPVRGRPAPGGDVSVAPQQRRGTRTNPPLTPAPNSVPPPKYGWLPPQPRTLPLRSD